MSVREHKKEANRITYKSRPTEVEYTTMSRMCPESLSIRGGKDRGRVMDGNTTPLFPLYPPHF